MKDVLKMKKGHKIAIASIASAAGVIVLFCAFAAFELVGWKYFDYYFCAKPYTGLSYDYVDVQDNKVDLYFYPLEHLLRFVGYDYYVEDDVLYVGFKVSLFWGRLINLPEILSAETDHKVSKVVLKGGGEEEVVYENGRVKDYNGKWIE